MRVQLRQFATPFEARLTVAVADCDDSGAVVAAGFVAADELIAHHLFEPVGDDLGLVTEAVSRWLARDFAALDPLYVDQPGSEFRLRVWSAVREIPPGQTLTYGQVAESIGRPRAARAVGSACGANAVAPFVPCHRVVPSSGGVGQYGYGSKLKKELLSWERAN